MEENKIYESTPQTPNDFEQNGNGHKGISIASMVLGIISLVLCCCFGFNLILAIPALIMGIIALVKRYEGKGMALAGVILSSIATLLTALILISSGKELLMFKDIMTFFMDYPESVETYEATDELPDYLEKYTGEEYDYLWEQSGYDDFYEFLDEMIDELEVEMEANN